MKISQAVWEYINDPAAGLRTPSSVKTYEQQLNHFISATHDPDINEVDPDDIVDWVLSGNVSTATQSLRRTVVVSFYRWAEFRDHVTGRNPARKIQGLKINRKRVRPGNWLTAQQVADLLKACDTGNPHGDRDAIVIMLGVFIGLRRTEISQLTWGDVNLSTGTVRLVGKGEKLAQLGLPAQLAEALTAWRKQFPTVNPSTPVVCRVAVQYTSWTGAQVLTLWQEPVGQQGIYHIVRRRAQLAGIPGLAPHDLRRTYAGLAHQNLTLEDVSKLLRHSDISTTQRYLADDPTRTVTAGQNFRLDLTEGQ